MAALAIGVDVGGTKIAAGVVDEAGNILERSQVPTPAEDPAAIVSAIVGLAREVDGGRGIGDIGVCVAGFIDRSRSKILFAPNLAWRDVALREQLEDSLQATCVIENDANAAAWGEFRFGAGHQTDDLLMITVGTGVGGGIINDGRLLHGGFGVAAEIGHIGLVPGGQLCGCGNSGCLESYGSGTALVRHTRVAAKKDTAAAAGLIESAGGDPDEIQGPQITQAALDGDPFAQEQISETGRWLGMGAAHIAEIIDPGVVVVGGGVSRAGDLLLEPMRESYLRHLSAAAHRPIAEIRVAELGNDAGLVGAADLANTAKS
jgi:glucokinase